MWPNLQESADLVKFTEKILHGKLHFFVQCMFFENPNALILIFLLFSLNLKSWSVNCKKTTYFYEAKLRPKIAFLLQERTTYFYKAELRPKIEFFLRLVECPTAKSVFMSPNQTSLNGFKTFTVQWNFSFCFVESGFPQ